MREKAGGNELMPGTLEMLILKTLSRGSAHGYAIAQSIRQVSDDVLPVEEGSLYPALQRLEVKGWVESEGGVTDTNRRARFYRLTVAGRKRLGVEVDNFGRVVAAITRVLQTS